MSLSGDMEAPMKHPFLRFVILTGGTLSDLTRRKSIHVPGILGTRIGSTFLRLERVSRGQCLAGSLSGALALRRLLLAAWGGFQVTGNANSAVCWNNCFLNG